MSVSKMAVGLPKVFLQVSFTTWLPWIAWGALLAKICSLHPTSSGELSQFRETCFPNCLLSWSLVRSPELKAHRCIGRHPSVCRPSIVNIFKWHLLWSHEADSYQISHIASIGWEKEKLCFLFQSDKNSGCYSSLQLPLTYNGNSCIYCSHCRYFDKFCRKVPMAT